MTREQALENALRDAEFILRKLAINPKEAPAMRDTMLRAGDDSRAALALPPDNADMLAALRECAEAFERIAVCLRPGSPVREETEKQANATHTAIARATA